MLSLIHISIDLIDEACSSIRIEIDSMPIELDDVTRRITQLEIEKVALEKEKDLTSKERLKKLKLELSELREKEAALREKWLEEKQKIQEAKEIKKKLENARFELENSFNQGDYKRASEIKYGEIPALEKMLEETQRAGNTLLSEVVTEDVIAKIVSRATNIPVTRILKGDREKVLGLRETLKSRVIRCV